MHCIGDRLCEMGLSVKEVVLTGEKVKVDWYSNGLEFLIHGHGQGMVYPVVVRAMQEQRRWVVGACVGYGIGGSYKFVCWVLAKHGLKVWVFGPTSNI